MEYGLQYLRADLKGEEQLVRLEQRAARRAVHEEGVVLVEALDALLQGRQL